MQLRKRDLLLVLQQQHSSNAATGKPDIFMLAVFMTGQYRTDQFGSMAADFVPYTVKRRQESPEDIASQQTGLHVMYLLVIQ